MKNRDVISSLFLIVVGAFFCIGAWPQGLMNPKGVPGPGCLPFLVGVALILLSLVILSPAVFKSKESDSTAKTESFFPQEDSFRKLVIALIFLLAYAAFLESLGYFFATFLFMLFALRFIEPQGWRTVLLFSFLTTALSFALFRALKVELPIGSWGI